MSKISYQLYSSRNFGPMPDTLQMLAGIGYKNVEGFGGLFNDPQALAVGLAANGMEMPTSHFGLDQVENQSDWVIDIAKTVGIETILVPHIGSEGRGTDGASWEAFGRRLQNAGAPLRKAGLRFGWHNHDFEFVRCTDGTMPMDAVLNGGPELAYQMDIAWVVRGGEDAVDWINTFKDRIMAVHVKDIAPEGECADEDGWADVGHGTMDWAAINAALAGVNVEYSVMEHDNPNDDQRFASRSFAAASAF